MVERYDLRKDAVEEHLQLGAAHRAYRLDRPRLNILDSLGDDLGNEPDRAHAHREHAGECAKADRGNEE